MKVPEGVLVLWRMVAGFLILASVVAVVVLALSYKQGQLVAAHLFFVGLVAVGLFTALMIGTDMAERLRRLDSVVAFVVELGLSTVGPAATVYFLFWLFAEPASSLRLLYVALPEVATATVVVTWLSRKGADVAFSLGLFFLGWALFRGTNQLWAWADQSLASITLEYGTLAGVLCRLLPIGVGALMLKLSFAKSMFGKGTRIEGNESPKVSTENRSPKSRGFA